jgi:hypothetical protein
LKVKKRNLAIFFVEIVQCFKKSARNALTSSTAQYDVLNAREGGKKADLIARVSGIYKFQ